METILSRPPVIADCERNKIRWAQLERLEAQVAELWGYLTAATYQFLVLVAELDRNTAYERHGLASTAQWLTWWCGIGKGAAREKVRVARALEHLPLISAGFKNGEFSYSKVRAMTRVATPANETVLANIARHGTATHVENLAKRYRWTQEHTAARQANGQHLSRYLHHHTDSDGMYVLQGRLPPEIGALMERALEAAGDILRAAEERPETASARHDVSA